MNVAYATNTTARTVYHAVVTRNRARGKPDLIVSESLKTATRRGLVPDSSGAMRVRFADDSFLFWTAADGFSCPRNDHLTRKH